MWVDRIVYSVIVRQGTREWRMVIDYSYFNVDRMAWCGLGGVL